MPFVESFLIIWVDAKLQPDYPLNDDIQHSQNILHQIVNTVELFDTSDKCIDFIHNKVQDQKIFLIVSGSIGQELVPQIEDDSRLDSIYIFCWDKSKHEQWATKEQHHKINGIFTRIEDLCDQLKEDVKHGHHELTSIQTLGSQTSNLANHLDASFMYSQLLKEILFSINCDETQLVEEKNAFVEFCRNQYAANNVELDVIEEFVQNYRETDAIWWYTRECFLYSMLNRALCAQDVEILMKMSFFICDLHRQLEKLHKTIDPNQVLTVYRGQGMLPTAFDRLRQNEGGLISFNNFLSTSTSKEVSLGFLEKALRKTGKVAVLFEMMVDPSISSIPFASLDQLSYFKESEKEILFSMHTVFRIVDIKADDSSSTPRWWHVKLTSTNDDDEQLRQLTEYMRSELTSFVNSGVHSTMEPTWRLGKLLTNMGEYEKALIVWEMILQKAIRDNNLVLIQSVHFELAEFFIVYQDDWNQAKIHLKAMFSVSELNGEAVTDEAKTDIINIYSNMGSLLMRDQFDEGELFSTMADLLEELAVLYHDHCAEPLGPLNYQLIADTYIYIGWGRRKLGNLPVALTNFEHALEFLHEHLPPTHPRLAMTYHQMGLVHADMENHLTALEFLEKGLQIQEKALQPHHPHLAQSHFHLSNTFEHLHQIDDAFEHAKRAVEIGRQAFLPAKQSPMKDYRKHYHRIRTILHSSDELVL